MDIQGVLRDLDAQVQEQMEGLNFNPIGLVKWRTERLHNQAEYILAQAGKVTTFLQAQANLQRTSERLEQQKELEDLTFDAQTNLLHLTIQQSRAQEKLVAAATQLGLDVPTLNQYRLNQLNVAVDVDKHRQLKDIDDEMEERSVGRQLRAALAYQQGSIEQAEFLFNKVIAFVQKLHDLEYSGRPIDLIQSQRPYYQMVIDGLKVKLEGLLQGNNQEDTEGGNANPFGRQLSGPDLATSQE